MFVWELKHCRYFGGTHLKENYLSMKSLFRSLLLALSLAMAACVQAQTLEESVAALHRKDFSAAFAGLSKLAEQGSASAQFYLGEMYRLGRGVPKDEQQAAAWWRKAAEQGNSSAQYKLGMTYYLGRGQPKDEQQGIAWFRKAAELGNADAQHIIGLFYKNGNGVPMDQQQAAAWIRKAAEQGNEESQYIIGAMYLFGDSLPKDEQMAYFWSLLASAQGHKAAAEIRDIAEKRLSSQQRTETQAAARNWRPINAEQNSSGRGGSPASVGGSNPNPNSASAQASSTGSGFRVARGAIVTNHHVIDGCSRLLVNGTAAQLRGSDARSDLALLAVTLPGPSARMRTQRAAVGEPVAVAGYPLRGLLSGFNLTTGTLSSLSGLGGDTHYLQVTAPVQPGNSGGPMLDSAGNLMGVVVSKLDAIKLAKVTGDIPQNVNFAINVNVLRSFMDANSVDYENANSDKPLPATVIAEKARGFTVLVECWK